MPETFSYAANTTLPRDLVWNLFTEIKNWPKCSIMFHSLEWHGEPWVPGSIIIGELDYPLSMSLRYLVKQCDPPELVKYLFHSPAAGFATERTVYFKPLPFGTLIEVESYDVGTLPNLPGGIREFLQSATQAFFVNFTRFCDDYRVEHFSELQP
jgi:hypothetical protein